MYKIKINPLALRDLQEIRAYLMEKELNSDLAIKVLRQIVGRYEQLRDYPLMGMSLSDLTGISEPAPENSWLFATNFSK
jgi:plasmid stabilization system protein ParE